MKEIEKKKIEVVEGDGNELDISPVYNHVNVNRNPEKPKNIVVPKSSKEKESEKKENH